MNLSDEEKKYLLEISRKTIQKKDRRIWLSEEEILNLSDNIKSKSGGFVTLHKNNSLRGCVGYIFPEHPMYKTVIENSYNAAYSDYRFPQLKDEELSQIEIEISILTIPEKILYNDISELKKKVIPNIHGVIIKKGYYSSTFLPQVWEQLTSFEDFFSHLCMKASLRSEEWKNNTLEVEVYKAIIFNEKEFF